MAFLKDKSKILQTVAYYAAFIALGLMMASAGPVLTDLATQTQSELRQLSALLAATGIGYLLGSLLGGALYDRLPGNLVMGAMLVLMSLMLAAVPLVPWLWVLVFIFLLMGMTGGAVDVGGNTLLVWAHRESVGPFMNGLHFFYGVGAFLSPIIIAQVMTPGGGVRWAYWTLALLLLPAAAVVFRAPSPTPEVEKHEPDNPAGPRVVLTMRAGMWLVWIIAGFFFLYSGAESGFGNWIATYAKEMASADRETAAYLTSAFWGALTIGRLLAIPIAIYVKPSLILLTDLLGCVLSVGLVLLWPTTATVIWLGALGLGLSMASIFPTMISLAERRLEITGEITSYFFVGASTGATFLPWLMGQLFESAGPYSAPVIVGGALVAALGVFAILTRHTNRQS